MHAFGFSVAGAGAGGVAKETRSNNVDPATVSNEMQNVPGFLTPLIGRMLSNAKENSIDSRVLTPLVGDTFFGATKDSIASMIDSAARANKIDPAIIHAIARRVARSSMTIRET